MEAPGSCTEAEGQTRDAGPSRISSSVGSPPSTPVSLQAGSRRHAEPAGSLRLGAFVQTRAEEWMSSLECQQGPVLIPRLRRPLRECVQLMEKELKAREEAALVGTPGEGPSPGPPQGADPGQGLWGRRPSVCSSSCK